MIAIMIIAEDAISCCTQADAIAKSEEDAAAVKKECEKITVKAIGTTSIKDPKHGAKKAKRALRTLGTRKKASKSTAESVKMFITALFNKFKGTGYSILILIVIIKVAIVVK